jgi:hypothetical protein
MNDAVEAAYELRRMARRNAALPCITLDRDRNGDRLKYMAHASGYVMVRLPKCLPFVLSEKDWRALPLHSEGGE